MSVKCKLLSLYTGLSFMDDTLCFLEAVIIHMPHSRTFCPNDCNVEKNPIIVHFKFKIAFYLIVVTSKFKD